MLKRIYVALALALGVVAPGWSASAATVADFGEIGLPTVNVIGGFGFGGAPGTSFEHDYLFAVPSAADLVAFGVEFSGPFTDLTSFTADLFEGDPTLCGSGCALLASATLPTANPASFLLSYAGLQSGLDYFLRVSSTIGATGFGVYTGLMAVSAVPVPPALLLFGTALAGVAALARRRRKTGTGQMIGEAA